MANDISSLVGAWVVCNSCYYYHSSLLLVLLLLLATCPGFKGIGVGPFVSFARSLGLQVCKLICLLTWISQPDINNVQRRLTLDSRPLARATGTLSIAALAFRPLLATMLLHSGLCFRFGSLHLLSPLLCCELCVFAMQSNAVQCSAMHLHLHTTIQLELGPNICANLSEKFASIVRLAIISSGGQ